MRTAKDVKGKKPMAMEIIREEKSDEEEFSFPVLHQEEEFSFPVLHQEDEFSFPVLHQEEEFSFPVLHPEEEFSFPILHQEEEFSFPIANKKVKPPSWRGSKKLAAGIAERGRQMRAKDAVAQLLFYMDEAFSEPRSAAHQLQMLEWAFAATGVLKTTLRSGEEEDAPSRQPLRCALGSEPVPEFFVCPVSKKIMDEPVIIASGKTFERSAIEEWLNKGNHTCPLTGEVLSNTILIPDKKLTEFIQAWHSLYGYEEKEGRGEADTVPAGNPHYFYTHLWWLSVASGSERAETAKKLRELASKDPSILHPICRDPSVMTFLVQLLFENHCKDQKDSELQLELLKILHIGAQYEAHDEALRKDQHIITVLCTLLREDASIQIKTTCAVILSRLSNSYADKAKIGEHGVMGQLVELLKASFAETKAAAASLIASICEARENWGRAFKEKAGVAALHAVMKGDDPVKEAVPILCAVRSCNPIFDEMLCELVSLRRSMDKPKWASLGMEIIEATTDATKPTIAADHANVEIAEVLWWLQNRCHFPRTVGYKRNPADYSEWRA